MARIGTLPAVFLDRGEAVKAEVAAVGEDDRPCLTLRFGRLTMFVYGDTEIQLSDMGVEIQLAVERYMGECRQRAKDALAEIQPKYTGPNLA